MRANASSEKSREQHSKQEFPMYPCPRGHKANIPYHFFLPSNSLQQFPVSACTHCYNDVVKPAVERGSSLAREWSPNTATAEYFCMLYSPRLRAHWKQALERNDGAEMSTFVYQRHLKLQNFSQQLELLRGQYQAQMEQINYLRTSASLQSMQSASALASAGSVPGGGGSYYVAGNVRLSLPSYMNFE
jgi:hypothetical protein